MRHQAGLEQAATLRVAVEFTDSRSLGITWAPETAAHKKFEYARIFLVALHEEPHRTYLDIVERHPWTSIQLPGTLAEGDYAIEVDAYGSASWGDGRLEARGRSGTFRIDS
ncbi:hypothetical protein [Nocardia crassostreae]|uniref:hypothetical protein n=1 Tax=Nocardia crassostreae TaxID=53428 RepID=UPI000833757B|nr:hypothetical protein [Nocardia crassostreae]